MPPIKVSICIVCMNRTMHLRETLPRNIQDNLDYPDLEIVLLDYGSRDDMAEWVPATLGKYIQSGLVKYYRNDDPVFFKISHAKNMAFRLATGDVLCSVDADNYTGKGFAAYVAGMFGRNGNIFLAAPRLGPARKWWDVQGRLCLWKEDFYAVRGYDEQIVDYGYEDLDCKERLAARGRERIRISNPDYLQAITHDNHLRVTEGSAAKKLYEMIAGERPVIGERSAVGERPAIGKSPVIGELPVIRERPVIGKKPAGSYEIICLNRDGRFERFCIDLPQPYNLDLLGEVRDPQLEGIKYLRCGNYENREDGLCLFKPNHSVFLHLRQTSERYLETGDRRRFVRLSPGDLHDKIMMEKAIHMGRKKLLHNRENPVPVNLKGFGTGCVRVNFSGQQIELGSEIPQLAGER